MTTCLIPAAPGSAVLSSPDAFPALIDLPLTCEDGWSLEQLQIGFPAVRPVVRNRAIGNGVFDDTFYVGARAVTITLRMATPTATQAAIDRVMPFMSPYNRAMLTWSLAGSPTSVRTLRLRGVDAPVVIDGPSYQRLVLSFVSTESFMRGEVEHCVQLTAPPTTARTYDLTFDRIYQTVPPVVSTTIVNAGNAPAPWRAVINADAVNPILSINGIAIAFNQNGGVNLTGFDQLYIDSDRRSILITPFPLSSAYDRVDFYNWRWDNLLLQPGPNLIDFQIAAGGDSVLDFCWFDTWW